MIRFRVRDRVRVRFRVWVRVRVRVWISVMDRVGKILRVNMASRTERNEKRLREDITSEYGFPYWNT